MGRQKCQASHHLDPAGRYPTPDLQTFTWCIRLSSICACIWSALLASFVLLLLSKTLLRRWCFPCRNILSLGSLGSESSSSAGGTSSGLMTCQKSWDQLLVSWMWSQRYAPRMQHKLMPTLLATAVKVRTRAIAIWSITRITAVKKIHHTRAISLKHGLDLRSCDRFAQKEKGLFSNNWVAWTSARTRRMVKDPTDG